MTREIKSVFLNTNLAITGSFHAPNVIFPSQFVIEEKEDGSVFLLPLHVLDGSTSLMTVHHIPSHNIACITYLMSPMEIAGEEKIKKKDTVKTSYTPSKKAPKQAEPNFIEVPLSPEAQKVALQKQRFEEANRPAYNRKVRLKKDSK